MNQLIMGLVLILTISIGVAVGVISGYLIISGILNAFARRPARNEATAVLAAQAASGD